MKKLSLLTTGILCFSLAYADEAKLPLNPQPLKDDVVVPMPCGINMTFRKVYTMANDKKKMDDLKFSVGISSKEDNSSLYAQDHVDTYIQGGFKDKKGYYYLIGKYEVTHAQYDALRFSDKCPDSLKDPANISKKHLLPAVNISWFDAVNTSKQFTLFLQSQQKKAEIDEYTYARLPTDSEWEFAASGGLDATDAQRDDKRNPLLWDGKLPETANDFAFFNSPQSANGKLKLIGLKKPNVLGIFDMLGNASEMIFEPFHATKNSRYHGQSGGFVVRGGSFRTVENEISTANRVEKSYIVKGKELATDDIGMRIVLNRIVATDTQDYKKIKEELLSLGTGETTGKAGGQKDDSYKKLLELEKSKFATENKDLQNQVTQIKNSMTKANAERDEMLNVAIVSNLKLGAFLCKSVNDENATYMFFDTVAKSFTERCKENEKLCERAKSFQEKADAMLKQRDAVVQYYADTMAEAIKTYDTKKINDNIKTAKMTVGNKSLESFMDMYDKHLNNYKNFSKDMKKNRDKWIKDCHSVVKKSK